MPRLSRTKIKTSTGKVWTAELCPSCGGHGVVAVYSAFDFEGPGECSGCGGCGTIWKSPKGRYALYPGGPFC